MRLNLIFINIKINTIILFNMAKSSFFELIALLTLFNKA